MANSSILNSIVFYALVSAPFSLRAESLQCENACKCDKADLGQNEYLGCIANHALCMKQCIIASQRTSNEPASTFCSKLATSAKALPIDLIPQQQDSWCWAAAAETVMKYLGHDIKQCVELNQADNKSTCCNSPSLCDHDGTVDTPLINNHFYYFDSGNKGLPQPAMSFCAMQKQINNNDPVIDFIQPPSGGGGHFLVVSGYVASPIASVLILDPEPEGEGDVSLEPYAQYVSGNTFAYPNWHHSADIYDIQYIGH